MTDTLNMGQELVQGKFIRSPNEGYYLTMQTDGNLVLYTSKDFSPHNAVWSSKTAGKSSGPYKLAMQTDGNLVVYDKASKPIWDSGTAKTRRGLLPFALWCRTIATS